MTTASLPSSPAAERNQGPILAQLRALLGPTGSALEIASGTGQHAAHFAAALPGWRWQPTDQHPTHFDSITGWALKSGARNVLTPLQLDVQHTVWPSGGATFQPPFAPSFDLIFCDPPYNLGLAPKVLASLDESDWPHERRRPAACLATRGPRPGAAISPNSAAPISSVRRSARSRRR